MSLLWVFSSASLFAQDTELGKVIVTATGKKMKILDTNASISVITAKDIEKSGKKTAGALITMIPGVINQKGSSCTNISVRGTRPTSGHSSGAMVFIDGVPLINGYLDMSSIDLIPVEMIEKIEVIKSASSSLYGKNSGLGVILITTKKGKRSEGEEGDTFHGKLAGEYGSWKTYSMFADIRGTFSGLDYSLSASNSSANGYRHTDNKNKSISGNMGMSFDGGRVEFNASYIDTSYIYAQGLKEQLAKEHPRYINGIDKLNRKLDGNDKESTFYNTGLNFRYDKNDIIANATLLYGRENSKFDKKSKIYYTADKPVTPYDDRKLYYKYDSVDNQYTAKLNGGYRLILGNNIVNTFNIGSDYNYETYTQDKTYPYIHSEDNLNDYDMKRKTLGINLNNDFAMGIFRFIMGLRYNKVTYEYYFDKVTGKKDFDKKFDNAFGYTISPSVSLIKDSNLFVTYNHTNHYPELSKYTRLHDNEGSTDPDLPRVDDLGAEVLDSLEVGFKHQFMPALNYSIIAYRTKISDKFSSFYKDTDGDGKLDFQGSYNVGDSIHQGIEVEVDGRPHELIGYRLGLSTIKAEWEKGKTKDGDNLKGKQLVNVPTYEYRVGLDIYPFENKSFGSLLISSEIYGFSEQWGDELNESDDKKMEAAYFVDMKVQYDFQNFGAHVTCTNLFDKQWSKVSAGKWYPQDGRYIGVGASAKI